MKKLVLLAMLLVGVAAIASYFSARREGTPLAETKQACNWLHEVKRTNTWFERDQNMRIAAHKLQQQRRTDKSITDLQVSQSIAAVVANDRQLQNELDDLVARCGWPTTSGYGDKAPQYASFIVQHAELHYQEKYLPIMQAAATAGELPSHAVATLTDRILMRKNLPQRYGSQLTDASGTLTVYPIEDPQHVDARRAEAGMIPVSFCAYVSMFTPQPQSDLCAAPKQSTLAR